MRRQARIIDPGNGRMPFEEAGDFQRVFTVALHTNTQRFNAAQRQPGVERTHAAAGDIFQPNKPSLVDKLLLADDNAANHVPVAVDVFSDAVHHDVCAQLQRLLTVGRHKGVIHHQQCALLMGNAGHRFNINQ